MFSVTESPEGVEFEVLAKPKASRNAIIGVHDGAVKIAVTAAPEKGKANKAIVRLLARFLDIPSSSIAIVKGQNARRKRIRVVGTSADAVRMLARELSG